MMKMKNVLIPLCLAVLLTATACGGAAPSSVPASDPSSVSASDSAPSSLPESEAAPVAAETKTIVGVITDGTMNTVTIKTDDGKALSFAIPDEADKTGVNGMTIGDTLEITYTGEIADDVTTDAVITKLVQTAAPTASSLPASDAAALVPGTSDAAASTSSTAPVESSAASSK